MSHRQRLARKVNLAAEHGPGLLQELRGFSFAMPVAVHDGGAGGSAMDAPHCHKTGAFRQGDITPEMPLWSIGGRPRYALERIGPAGPYASILRPGKNRRQRE